MIIGDLSPHVVLADGTLCLAFWSPIDVHFALCGTATCRKEKKKREKRGKRLEDSVALPGIF